MLWVPRKMPTGKGHLFLKSLSTVQSMEANSDTHVPAGTGPAPIRADTSTVNAFRLKSYFSKELCVSLCLCPGQKPAPLGYAPSSAQSLLPPSAAGYPSMALHRA